MEISGGGMDFVHPGALELRQQVGEAARRLSQALERFDGVVFEYKGAVADRSPSPGRRSDSVAAVNRAVDAEMRPFLESGALKMTPAKMSVEVLPNVAMGQGGRSPGNPGSPGPRTLSRCISAMI